MLKPGDKLPEFIGDAWLPKGEIAPFKAAEYKGKWVTLFFWPLDFTFVCPTEIQGYNALVPDFKKADCVLLGASIDSAFVHKAWTEHGLGKMNFPMLGDVSKSLARGCGVLNADGVALRATFIANPDGVIEAVTINALNAGRSPKETLRTLQALQTGELTACEWQPGQAFVKAG